MDDKGQSGHILFLMTLLLSTSGGAILLFQSSTVSIDRPIDRALVARIAIDDARTALLAYSSDYAALYGPTGAGPGHLPCPDTDDGNDPALDGPNPPCGKGLNVSGALPRNVTLPRQRFAFHDEPEQRIRYAVSAGYVNNPTNRLVNASGALERFVTKGSLLVASLWIPSVQAFNNGDEGTRTIVTTDELMEVVHPAVARWVRDKVAGQLLLDCLTEASCPKQPELFEDESGPVRSMRELSGADLIPLISDPQTGFIDQVPASRHWFVRNGWYDDVVLRVSSECKAAQPLITQPSIECEFVLATGDSPIPITIILQRRM